ncbi:MAG: hypothetical protein E3J82_05850 [Candidatus Thorarchaeota archaeon]|nr:MAG: hypothetical protein E3J82_05850 [Candidatus Thorarchaeota archaeon]
MTIEGDLSIKIQAALVALGHLDEVLPDEFPQAASSALMEFMNINNFENKARDDGTIWQSVLDSLLHESGLDM